ncbi:hypothetical protein, partial [Acetobacter sp.]|uniref:hypothetical protein n=1 Tax=Acetobacter sp. TaxID=440 RepID=UPI0039E985AA
NTGADTGTDTAIRLPLHIRTRAVWRLFRHAPPTGPAPLAKKKKKPDRSGIWGKKAPFTPVMDVACSE